MVGKAPIENAIGMIQKKTVSNHLKLTFFFSVVHENNVFTAANNNEVPIKTTILTISLSSLYLNSLDEKKLLENSNYLLSELDDPISVEEIEKGNRKLKNKKGGV